MNVDAGSSVPAVLVSQLTIQYQSPDSSFTAVSHFSLEVQRGQFVSIIGPSGCGKTTLLRAIGDLLPAICCLEGTIHVAGTSPREARKKNEFGLVFQDPVLLPWRTALGNVKLPLEVIRNASRRSNGTTPLELLELVGLRGFEHALARQLSGGMKQRVAIARMLAYSPSVYLMDEPFGSLDEISRERLNLELLKVWEGTAKSVVFVTHSIPEAVFLSDRVVVMSAAPGHNKRVIDVSFPRPREIALKKTTDFLTKCNEIRDELDI